MPTKLKDLKITNVDFVDAGANPDANILLFKNKDGAPAAPKSSPSAKGGEKKEGAVKKFFSAISKALGIGDEDVDQAIEEITKGYEAETFNERMDEVKRRQITSEIWDVCYALEESLCSIILDDEVAETDKSTLMNQSLDEFSTTVKEIIPTWASGKTTAKITKAEHPITPARLEDIKTAIAKLKAIVAKATACPEGKPAKKPKANTGGDKLTKTMKGDCEDMKIDKSKLTPEELATLEIIEKKAGIQEETPPAPAGSAATGVEKGTAVPAAVPAAPAATATPSGEGEDIYKGLHPAIKAELEKLRKAADAAEDRELTEIAKKYEIIGKKPEELVPLFKSLKAAGGDAYTQMLTVLDAGVAAVEKSGLFSEIGKKGNGEADAWVAIEKHADEILKAAPTLTRAQAIDKACEQHPELVHEYENKR